jgi:hypothetical protein
MQNIYTGVTREVSRMENQPPKYLTLEDLMKRWYCKRAFALNFMHREGSGAIKIGRRLLVTEKEVERYEATQGVRTGR